jgi:hypothetical protein
VLRNLCIYGLWLVALALPLWCVAQDDVAEILRRSTEANDRDWAATPEFDNYECDHTSNGDKTYSVTMLYGSPYERLIALNGQNLDAAGQKEEQKKYEKVSFERKHESPQKRAQRIAKYEAGRKRDYTLLQQMTTAFKFQLQGKQTLDGYEVYVLKATPRPGYRPPDRDSQVLPGMEGTLWIDQKTYQWVKVEAHVIRPVRIDGFLAEVEPGTRFEVEKRPVTGDIWLFSHYSMAAKARVILMFPHNEKEDATYFDYHRSSPEQLETVKKDGGGF